MQIDFLLIYMYVKLRSTYFYSNDVSHVILRNIVNWGLSWQEHHNLIHVSNTLNLIHSCLRSFFPIWKILHFVSHHCNLVIYIINLLIKYLFELTRLVTLTLSGAEIFISKSFHSIGYCFQNEKRKYRSWSLIVDSHASTYVDTSYNILMEFYYFIFNISIVRDLSWLRKLSHRRSWRHSLSFFDHALWFFH